ncbi:MAG TPA: metal-dependent hydrolase [Aquificae bacterium]|nr:metal-dependent hydrolase [Aquificota bacterium]
MAKLTFIGHATWAVEGNNLKGIIDPFFDGNPQAAFKKDDFLDVNYIFLTHGHGDHIGDTIYIAKKSGATVIACFELTLYLDKFGVNTHKMHVGGRYKFPFGKVKLTPALHGNSIVDENGNIIYGGMPYGFVIEVDGKKVYHAGDTGLTMDMALLERENIDVALLPIGGNFTMDIEDALRAVELIKPKLAIPMHYNTWPIIEADPLKFVEGCKKLGVESLVVNPGESIEI